MDYVITAPVLLRFDGAGVEEEPFTAHVTASTREKAVAAFQEQAYEVLVNAGDFADVDFYPYNGGSNKYDITKSPSTINA